MEGEKLEYKTILNGRVREHVMHEMLNTTTLKMPPEKENSMEFARDLASPIHFT